YSITKKIHEALDAGRPARSVTPTDDEKPFLRELHLLTSKPVLYACNVNEDDFAAGGNEWTKKVAERADSENNNHLIICASLEAEIAQLDEEEQKKFLSSIGAE